MTPNEIKQARKEMGMTQAKLATFMGIGTRKIERWEAGHNPISSEGATLLRMLLEQHRQATGEQSC